MLMIEGKLAEDGHEPQNVQVSIVAREKSDTLDMGLIGEDGPLRTIQGLSSDDWERRTTT